jgi:hypothetical protein
MKRSLTLTEKGFVLVGVPLVCEFAFIAASMNLLSDTEREVARQAHSRAVLACCNSLIEDVYKSTASFKRGRFPDSSSMRHFASDDIPTIRARINELKELVKDNPEESRQAQSWKASEG